MAQAEQEARRRMEIAVDKLRTTATQVTTLVDRVAGAAARLSASTLARKVTALDKAWEQVGEAYGVLGMLLEDDARMIPKTA